ncbi:MAG: NAD(P)H-binding protein [Myxococcaceae bacterium]
MSEDVYVVVGASGHVGSGIAQALARSGKQVRAVVRNARRLPAQPNIQGTTGSIEDAAFLEKAFTGAKAAFVMIPPNFAIQSGFRRWQNRVGDNIARALEINRVPFAMSLSSVGAHLPEGNGPIGGLYDFERRLNKIQGLHVLHLRPASFLENHLNSIGVMKSAGFNGGAFRADLAMPQIATSDIAVVAARRLLALDWKGSEVLELLGAADVTMAEVTRAFGRAVGKPDLAYRQFPYADAQKAIVGMGVPEELAAAYMEMTRGMNEGTIRPTQKRSAETTTSTTVDTFAETVFATVFNTSR